MATSPLITTYLGEIRTAIAGMSAPTYNHTLSSANVGDSPDGDPTAYPWVAVYLAGDVQAVAITLTDREITARIHLDVRVQAQGSYNANSAAAVLFLHDLAQLLHSARRSSIFAAYGKIIGMDQTLNYHGDAEIGGVLAFGRMTLTLRYQRDSAGGF